MVHLIGDRLPNLATVFFGILLEAAPFLLFGVLVSSALDVFVSSERLARVFPRSRALGLVSGVALGAAAPLCECGTVPIARGTVSRGLPLPTAIGFLLAAPVINPITVAATYTAFQGDLSILALRIGLGIGVALLVGGLFLLWPDSETPLRATGAIQLHDHSHDHGAGRLWTVLDHAGHELTSLMPYLLGACLAASLLQVFLPRTQLLSLGQGPLLSVVVMMLVAVVLSTCSSVDAFVALAFSTTFSTGAILAFLLISPVLNLKSGALVLGLFRPSVALPLLGAASLTIAVASLAINYHLVAG